MHTGPRAADGQGLVAWVGWASLALIQLPVGSPTPHSCRGLGPSGSVSLCTSVMYLSLSLLCPVRLALLVHSSSTIPTLGKGLLRGTGALCLSLGEVGPLRDHVLPRPASVPLCWGAVPVWGNVCCEERESRVCMPADVLRNLRSCVWQRWCHVWQHLRTGGHSLCPWAGDPGGSQRTLWSVVGKWVYWGVGPSTMVMEPPPQTAVGSAALEPCARLRLGAVYAPLSAWPWPSPCAALMGTRMPASVSCMSTPAHTRSACTWPQLDLAVSGAVGVGGAVVPCVPSWGPLTLA